MQTKLQEENAGRQDFSMKIAVKREECLDICNVKKCIVISSALLIQEVHLSALKLILRI